MDKNVIGLFEWSTDVVVTGMGLELPIRVEFTTLRSRNRRVFKHDIVIGAV